MAWYLTPDDGFSEAQKFAYAMLLMSVLGEFMDVSHGDVDSWDDVIFSYDNFIGNGYRRLDKYASLCALSQAVDAVLDGADHPQNSTLEGAAAFLLGAARWDIEVEIEMSADSVSDGLEPIHHNRQLMLAIYYGAAERDNAEEMREYVEDEYDIEAKAEEIIMPHFSRAEIQRWEILLDELQEDWFVDDDQEMDGMFNIRHPEAPPRSSEEVDKDLKIMKAVAIAPDYYVHALADMTIPNTREDAIAAMRSLCAKAAQYGGKIPEQFKAHFKANIKKKALDKTQSKALMEALKEDVGYAARLPEIFDELYPAGNA